MKVPLDPRRWARLFVCTSFYLVVTGLGESILRYALGVTEPERVLFLPGLIVAFVVGWFCVHDRREGRLAEAGNLAGIITAARLWIDLSFARFESGLPALAFFARWWIWGAYLGNVLVILLAGWWMERRRQPPPM